MSQIPETGKVIVQFGAEWCNPCKLIKPYVTGLAQQEAVPFMAIDIEANVELATKHNIRNIPTIIAFIDGREVGRVNGSGQSQIRNVIINALRG